MEFILVNGKKRAGKDYFAQSLKKELETLGHTAQVMSFADPIKDMMATTFNITHEQLDEMKNEEAVIGTQEATFDGYECYHLTDMRKVLQNFGTEAMKPWFGEDVWVELLLKNARDSGSDFVIVPDFRFLTENIEGGFTVKICNSDVENNASDNHRSENELNDFEFMYEIDNTGHPDVTKLVQDLIKELMLFKLQKESN
jgi:hypothetical protein